MQKQILDALTWRYATKLFDPSKKLSQEQLDSVLEAIRLAPSSFGLQNFRVVVVKDPATKAKLREVGYGQAQFTDADTYLVFCVQNSITEEDIEDQVNRTAQVRNIPVQGLDGYRQMLLGFINNKSQDELVNWATRQLYIALGFGLSAAANIGVDACPMEGFDASKFDEVLNLHDQNLKAVVGLALGFRSADDHNAKLPKVRLPKDKLFL